MPDHLDYLREALRSSIKSREFGPWKLVVERAVGTLFAVGFERESENVLAISSNGQGVIDCKTGDLLYRNREDGGFDLENLSGRRLDIAGSPSINMAGPCGGGLKQETSDGWTVASYPIDWPETYFIAQPPGASIFWADPKWSEFRKDSTFFLLERDVSDAVAFGFSWSGKSLLWADSARFLVWGRA